LSGSGKGQKKNGEMGGGKRNVFGTVLGVAVVILTRIVVL